MNIKQFEKLLCSVPASSIPKPGTKAHQYLMLLLKHYPDSTPEERLNLIFNGRQRSPLQSLMGDRYQYWFIHPIEDKSGVIVARKLDDRHFLGRPDLDAEARRERRRAFKDESYRQAKQGRIREPRAHQEKYDAHAEYLMSLGEAANDDYSSDNKKPLSE